MTALEISLLMKALWLDHIYLFFRIMFIQDWKMPLVVFHLETILLH